MERQTRTPEEIKKGLACISRHRMDDCDMECSKCDVYEPGWTTSGLCADALAYIQQLEAKDTEKGQRIAELEQELAAVKRERDAAIRDCSEFPCNTCDDRENRDLCCNCIKPGSTRRTNHVGGAYARIIRRCRMDRLNVSVSATLVERTNCICDMCHGTGKVISVLIPETKYRPKNKKMLLVNEPIRMWMCESCRDKLLRAISIPFQEAQEDGQT